MNNADLLRQRNTACIVDNVVRELIDECITFEKQCRDAEWQVQLRGTQSLGLIRPADVIDRDLRAMHDDRINIVRPKRRLALQVSDGVERGVVAADTRVEL